MKLTMLYRLVWNLLCSLGCPATCNDPPASASSKLEAQLHHHIPLTFSFEEAGETTETEVQVPECSSGTENGESRWLQR